MNEKPAPHNSVYTENFKDVFHKELAHITQKGKPKPSDRKNLWGLALSGGGIRSASFCIGVMQALKRNNLGEAAKPNALDRMDYLSSVSGGGYAGTAYTYWRHKTPEEFPFARKYSVPNKTGAYPESSGAIKTEETKKNKLLDYIRQHGNYLIPGSGVNGASLAGTALRSMLVSLVVYFSLLASVIYLLMSGSDFVVNDFILERVVDAQKIITAYPGLDKLFDLSGGEIALYPESSAGVLFLGIAVVWLGLFVLGALVYAPFTKMYYGLISGRNPYKQRVSYQIRLGKMLHNVLICASIGALALAARYASEFDMSTFAGSSTGGIVLGIFQFVRGRTAKKPTGALSSLVPVIAALLLLFGLGLGAFAVAKLYYGQWYIFGLIFAASLWLGIVANTNHLGIHRMYRDRLMEAFLPDAESVKKNAWTRAEEANDTLIEHMCGVSSDRDDQASDQTRPRVPPRPYHLINTNIVLVDSASVKYRTRGGDSFILSPLYCGSTATGWRQSKEYMKPDFLKKNSERGMTLATAMAISGAAANPNTGVGGAGLTRNRLVSTLMSLLHLRLGYWAPNPNYMKGCPETLNKSKILNKVNIETKKLEKSTAKYFEPDFIRPGIRGGVLTGVMHENYAYVELSDGGHFENLGIYELIRRRCKIIIACDGGADPDFEFGDLSNAVERVKVDFGAQIRFHTEEEEKPGNAKNDDEEEIEQFMRKFPLLALLPDSADENIFSKNYGLARRSFAVGSIKYPAEEGDIKGEEEDGLLIYLKTTLIPNLPPDVYGYRSANKDFPDQTTADQFFDEAQFEAYRELGYYACKYMCQELEMHGIRPLLNRLQAVKS